MNNTQDKWLDVSMKSEKVAKIKIHGVIGGGWFEEGVTDAEVEQDLEEVAALKANKIIVDLDSLGGSVKHGMKIHNLLKENPAEIEVNITGWTASMGTVIAMAGDNIKMVDNSFFLIHEARTVSWGTQSQLEADAKFIKVINETIADIYAERTGLSKDESLALMSVNGGEGEFWSASETEEKGFVDSIYKPEKNSRATAMINKEELNKYKINAKIDMSKQIENVEEVVETAENNTGKPFNLAEVTSGIVKAVKDAITPVNNEEVVEDVVAEYVNNEEEVNIEEIVTAQVSEAVKTIQADFDSKIEEKDNQIADLKAKNDVLNAGTIEPKADDADLEGNKNVTASDIAAEQFRNSLSEGDKLQFTINEKI